MLTIEATLRGDAPSIQLRSRWWINLDYVTTGIFSVVFAVPIALVFADGWLRLAGILYALAWFAVLVPSFVVYTWMIKDAWRLFRHGTPTLLRTAMIVRAVEVHRNMRIVLPHPLREVAQISSYANPIANLATTLTVQALRWRSDEVEAMWREILEESRYLQTAEMPAQVSKAAAAIALPVLERSSPEFACV